MKGGLNLFGLAPLTVGTLLFVFVKPYNEHMLRHMERTIRWMRKPGFLWLYRVYGIIFVVSGVTILFFSE